MSIQKALSILQTLQDRGVLSSYAVTGAVAALAYIQPTLTQDLDVLVEVSAFDTTKSGLLLTTRLDQALADLGYRERSDVGIVVEGWPIQFIPVASDLDQRAIETAQQIELGNTDHQKVLVLRPEYVVAKALEVGRSKDYDRVEAFLDQSAVDLALLKAVIVEMNLMKNWAAFCARVGRTDILGMTQ
jgi:hypothetical protein